jgi:DNA-binding beta-propeller fold protein YncE
MKRFLAPLAVLALALPAAAKPFATTPDGQALTPEAAPGARFEALDPGLAALPDFRAGQASATALSPDGKTLLVLTSGFNRNFGPNAALRPELSREYVFVYDVTGPHPTKTQVLQIDNSFLGLVWAPDGRGFYVSGGVNDQVIAFRRGDQGYAATRAYKLGHKAGLGIGVQPEAAGVAVSPDGRRLLVANVQNDSVSLVDVDSGSVTELDLRRGDGTPGGTFPRAVVFLSDRTAYVTAERDREVLKLELGDKPRIAARLKMHGQPVALAPGRHGLLYVALNNTDGVAVIDTASDRVVGGAATAGPIGQFPAGLSGASSNGLAVSADGRRLYVTNGGENALAVLDLGAQGRRPVVKGLIPTGWYPDAVAVSKDGAKLYVVNGKSPPGPNPGGCRNSLAVSHADNGCRPNNQYVWRPAGPVQADDPGNH